MPAAGGVECGGLSALWRVQMRVVFERVTFCVSKPTGSLVDAALVKSVPKSHKHTLALRLDAKLSVMERAAEWSRAYVVIVSAAACQGTN
eukprot:350664-Chlamydomonas_euryale.AAC.4